MGLWETTKRKLRATGLLAGSASKTSQASSLEGLGETTPHILALAIVQTLLDKDLAWRQVDPEVVRFVHDRVPMLCEFYQLSIFESAVERRFGKPVAIMVQASLSAIISRGGSIAFYERMREAIANAKSAGPAPEVDDAAIGQDLQAAAFMLASFSESGQSKEELMLPLAESLTYARIWAEARIPVVVSEVVFTRDSIAFVKLPESEPR